MIATPHRLDPRRLRDRVQRHLVALPSLLLPGPEPTTPEPPAPAPAGLRLTVHRRMCGAVVVVTVSGDLDADGARELGGRLGRILAGGSLTRLVVDLGRAGALSEAGVGALVEARDAGLDAGVPVRVVTRDDTTLDGCDVRIPTAPSVDAACAEAFPAGGTGTAVSDG
jgi:anti-anti-sigma regulatory factor